MGDVQLSPEFFIIIGGMFIGFLGLVVRYSYKSKCTEVSCCCCTITRDIQIEAREDLEIIRRDPAPPSRGSLDAPENEWRPAQLRTNGV